MFVYSIQKYVPHPDLIDQQVPISELRQAKKPIVVY